MKILFVANVKVHFLFHLPYMKYLQEQGYEVHACANAADYAGEEPLPFCDRFFDLPIARSPFKAANLKACAALEKIIDENGYRLVSCHTPMGGVLARLAARQARKRGTAVLYTAHGFHFYKGAPLRNWLLYYPAELFCARLADALVTMNQEDYAFAKKRFRTEKIFHVHGVGVDAAAISAAAPDQAEYRKNLGVPTDAILLLSVGELSRRKNHEVVIRALARLAAQNADPVYYAIAGTGALEKRLRGLIRSLGLEDRVRLLGYRNDVAALNRVADIACHPSFQEGLPVALMEAMAAGLPAICSDVRGNVDLIRQGEGGLLVRPDDAAGFAEAILRLAGDPGLRGKMRGVNLKNIMKYDISAVKKELVGIYDICLSRG